MQISSFSQRLQGKDILVYVLFFVFLFYSVLCRYFAIVRDSEVFVQYNLYFEVILCVPLLIYAKSKYGKSKNSWVSASIVFLLFEIVIGFIFSGILSIIVAETAFWIFFFAMFYLGKSRVFWECFLGVSVLLVLFTSILSLLEIQNEAIVYLRGMDQTESYLYKIQQGFAPVAIMAIFYSLSRRKSLSLISIVLFIFFVVLQFFFQKRLPLFRCVLYLLFWIFVARSFFSSVKTTRLVVVVVAAFLLLFSFIPSEYKVATFDRFYESGSITQTTQNDDRYVIAGRVIQSTVSNPRSLLFGQGVGGYLPGNFMGKVTIINGREVLGITGFEIGSVTMFMKYGIVFFFLYFGYILRLVINYKHYKKDPLTVSCWVYLSVYFIATMIGESLPDVDTPIFTTLVAGSMGFLSSNEAKKHHVYNITNIADNVV